jgi:Co/Zn/Cd efflux system component
MSEVFGALIDLWPVTTLVALACLWWARKQLAGSVRFFATLAAMAPICFLLLVVLHNGVWWLSTRLWGPPGVEEPVFFLAAVIGCPVMLLVGVVGALVVAVRRRGHAA